MGQPSRERAKAKRKEARKKAKALKAGEFRRRCEEQRRTTSTRGVKVANRSIRQWGATGEIPSGKAHSRRCQRARADAALDVPGVEARTATTGKKMSEWNALFIAAKKASGAGNLDVARDLVAKAEVIAPLTARMRRAVTIAAPAKANTAAPAPSKA